MTEPTPHAGAVRPFAGRLVTAEWAERVVSPMLDAPSPAARALVAQAPPDSWLNIMQTGHGWPEALQQLLAGDAFGPADRCYYVYRIEDATGTYDGLVADVEAAAFVDGRVRGHEAVQQARVEGVRRRFAAMPARSELVTLLHPSANPVGGVVGRAQLGPPVLSFTSADGLQQRVWRVDDQDEASISAALDDGPLYVADGHHRVAASISEWRAHGRPGGTTMPCVLYPPDGLRLQAFHRRVRGPVEGKSLVEGLRARLDVEPAGRDESGIGRIGIYVDGQWFCAAMPPSAAVGVDALDVTRLHGQVLGPLLGIEVIADPRLVVVSGSVDALVEACDSDGGAAFVLGAPTIGQLIDVADRGQVMMAKSTFFAPKPEAGIFLQVAD